MGLTKKDLEGGGVLRALVKEFKTHQNQGNMMAALNCLHDSDVLVPGSIFMTEDGEKTGNAAASKMRFDPYYLKSSDGGYFLPVFSNEEQVPEKYKGQFTLTSKTFPEAMDTAFANKKVTAIVLDPFTEPMYVPVKLFPMVAKMKTRIG